MTSFSGVPLRFDLPGNVQGPQNHSQGSSSSQSSRHPGSQPVFFDGSGPYTTAAGPSPRFGNKPQNVNGQGFVTTISDRTEPKKRQRIQQACKNCSIKRVRCDGQLPCATCSKAGDECEYGLAKKRGPPKGSNRKDDRPPSTSSLSNTPSTSQPVAFQRIPPNRRPAHAATPSSLLPAATQDTPIPPESTSALGSSSSSHTGIPPQFSEPSYPGHPQMSLYVGGPSPPRMQPPPLGTNEQRFMMPIPLSESNSPHPRPSDQPLASLPTFTSLARDPSNDSHGFERRPRIGSSYADPDDGTFVNLPHLREPSYRPRFRGGTSGILDFPRYRPHAPPPGSTSPSSFALGNNLKAGAFNDRITPIPPLQMQSGNPPQNSHRGREPSSLIDEVLSRRDTAEVLSSSTLTGLREQARQLLAQPEIPDEVESVLWTLFWQIVSNHWPVIIRERLPMINDQPRVDKESQPLLYHAVLALAARIWDVDRDGSLPYIAIGPGESLQVSSLSDLYFRRARYWLLQTDDEPSLEVGQALLLMSLREGGEGRQSSAAQYTTSACRVAFELGLHRDLRGRGIQNDELQARLRLFWCIFILDKTSAAALGRPCMIRYAETDCTFFELEEVEENREWMSSDLTPASATLAGQPVRSLSHLKAGCQLAIICEDAFRYYNSVRPGLDEEGVSEDQPKEPWWMPVLKLHERLETWKRELPPFLHPSVEGPTFQHVLLQQMWWNALRILVHRPYFRKQGSNYLPPSLTICTESANNICVLAMQYRDQHDATKMSSTSVYCLFIAAMVHLVDAPAAGPEAAASSKRQLSVAVSLLRAVGGTWMAARKQLVIIRHIGELMQIDLNGTGLEPGSLPGDQVVTPQRDSHTLPVSFPDSSAATSQVGNSQGASGIGLEADNVISAFNNSGLEEAMNAARSTLPQHLFEQVRDNEVLPSLPMFTSVDRNWGIWAGEACETLNQTMAMQRLPASSSDATNSPYRDARSVGHPQST